jgi:hypothetical protein
MVTLASTLTFGIDASGIPPVGSHERNALNAEVKAALAISAQGAGMRSVSAESIVIVSIHLGSVVVDYTILVPPAEATPALREAAVAHIAASTSTITIYGQTAQLSTATVGAFESFAWVKVASCIGVCSAVQHDTYRCFKDGTIAQSVALCQRSVGVHPSTQTECLPCSSSPPTDADGGDVDPENAQYETVQASSDSAAFPESDPGIENTDALLIKMMLAAAAGTASIACTCIVLMMCKARFFTTCEKPSTEFRHRTGSGRDIVPDQGDLEQRVRQIERKVLDRRHENDQLIRKNDAERQQQANGTQAATEAAAAQAAQKKEVRVLRAELMQAHAATAAEQARAAQRADSTVQLVPSPMQSRRVILDPLPAADVRQVATQLTASGLVHPTLSAQPPPAKTRRTSGL